MRHIDWSSQVGAEKLARRIEAYWAERGDQTVVAHVVCEGWTIYGVRSNLVVRAPSA